MKVIQKIAEGTTGAQAAGIIYNNDKELEKRIKDVSDNLDAYGSLVNISLDGQNVELVQTDGESATAVMSQRAVTDFVNDEVGDVCQIQAEIAGGLTMPDDSCYVNAWVSRASSNAQGHSLTILYDDVQDLKELCANLLQRVQYLESIIK